MGLFSFGRKENEIISRYRTKVKDGSADIRDKQMLLNEYITEMNKDSFVEDYKKGHAYVKEAEEVLKDILERESIDLQTARSARNFIKVYKKLGLENQLYGLAFDVGNAIRVQDEKKNEGKLGAEDYKELSTKVIPWYFIMCKSPVFVI